MLWPLIRKVHLFKKKSLEKFEKNCGADNFFHSRLARDLHQLDLLGTQIDTSFLPIIIIISISIIIIIIIILIIIIIILSTRVGKINHHHNLLHMTEILVENSFKD